MALSATNPIDIVQPLTVLLYDGSRGHHGIMTALIKECQLFDDESNPINEHVRGMYAVEAMEYLNDKIDLGELFVRGHDSGLLYRLEWREGDLWAIKSDAEWCDQAQMYVSPCPDDQPSWLVADHYVSPLIYGDMTGLSDSEQTLFDSFIEQFTDNKSPVPEVIGAHQGFTKCEITGLMANCYKVWQPRVN